MSLADGSGWHDQQPFYRADSAAQIRSLLAILGAPPRRLLDLGCGSGRVLVPLAKAGHEVVGMDRDAHGLRTCARRLGRRRPRTRLLERDFLGPWPRLGRRFDAILCLGHTFMMITDLDDVANFMRRAAANLVAGGRLVLDDFPQRLWSELTGGRWQDGVSANGDLEMRWERDDNVFTLRRRPAPRRGDGERRFRLWTMSQIALIARSSGFGDPIWDPAQPGLLVLTRGSRYRLSRPERAPAMARQSR